mmetsp:Transcript_12456/g.29311  ORF Transcript_12456/g.29311 Transcript_12456/m.29311 type:complete len:399 (-) Transcript_12456:359-1555(-)
MIAASGATLVSDDAMNALCSKLAPLATLLTPNLPEAEKMLNWPRDSIQTVERMQKAAIELHKLGCANVLVKGGHLGEHAAAIDVLYDGRTCETLHALRIDTSNSHGTGCTLSTAIASYLARGLSMREAVLAGKTYLTSALAASAPFRLGNGAHGPINHGFRTHSWQIPDSAQAADARRDSIRKALALYAVTDASLSASRGGVVNAALEALAGGVTCLQLRDKGPATRLLDDALRILPAARARGVPLIINDRVDIMMASDADGVHVGQDDMPAKAVRALIGPHKILGVSVSDNIEDALRALADGADYVGVGAIFASTTKPDKTATGIQFLVKMRSAVGSEFPIVAIGGIGPETAAACIFAGADGVALVSTIFATDKVRETSASLRASIEKALREGKTSK